MAQRAHAILLVGPIASGKSRFLERLVGDLRGSGVNVAGFLQRGVFAPDGRKIGYDLVGLATGAVHPLARRSPAGDRWLFEETAFAAALDELPADAELTVIDELGHLELSGEGHAAAVERALASSTVLLVVIREALADRAEAWLSAHAGVTRVRFDPGRDDQMACAIRESLSG
jgi:nucleoside-triphosphatase THEP1